MIIVCGHGVRTGTSAMMRLLQNDMGVKVVGEPYPAISSQTAAAAVG